MTLTTMSRVEPLAVMLNDPEHEEPKPLHELSFVLIKSPELLTKIVPFVPAPVNVAVPFILLLFAVPRGRKIE